MSFLSDFLRLNTIQLRSGGGVFAVCCLAEG